MLGYPKDVNKNTVCRYVNYIVREKCTIRECAEYFSTETHKVYPGTVYVYTAKYFKAMYPKHPYNQYLRNIWLYNKKHPKRRHSI